MKLLINNNGFIQNLFFEVNVKKKYSKSKFNIILQRGNKHIVYNTFSKVLAELTAEEYEVLHTNAAVSSITTSLIKAGFLVADDCDEVVRLKELLKVSKMLVNNTGFTTYTILPTLDCNARCFYCYESSCNKTKMSKETVKKLCKLILDNYNKNKQKILLDWYGGEPLYNSEVIDEISRFLNNNNIEFSSKMISNGYLFDENTVKRATELWKLKSIQITLDGTEKVYNRVKNYINACDNPFNRVLENIENLLKNNVRVKIRLNLSKNNFEDLLELIESLADRFSKYRRFTTYVHALFDLEEDPENEYIWTNIDIIETKLFQLGIFKLKKLESRISPYVCTAQNPKTVTVLPDGKICMCKTYFQESAFSDLNTGVIDNNVIENWSKESIRGEECFECALLPTCIYLKKCKKSQIKCSKTERENRLKLLTKMIDNTLRDC